jgi:hypothetical protein
VLKIVVVGCDDICGLLERILLSRPEYASTRLESVRIKNNQSSASQSLFFYALFFMPCFLCPVFYALNNGDSYKFKMLV